MHASTLFFRIFSLIGLVIILHYGRSVLAPLALAAILAVGLYPLARFLEKRRLTRALASILSMLFMSLVLFSFLGILAGQLTTLAQSYPEYETTFLGRIDTLSAQAMQRYPMLQNLDLDASSEKLASWAGSGISDALSWISGTLGNLFIIPLFTFFFLQFRGRLTTFILMRNEDNKDVLLSILASLRKLMVKYISGLGTVMLVMCGMLTAGLWLSGSPYPLVFALVCAVGVTVPYLGYLVAFVPTLILAWLTHDGFGSPLGVTLTFALVMFTEGYILTPMLIGSGVNINPMVAFLGLLCGGAMWGIEGMALALPTLAIIKVILQATPGGKPFAYLLGDNPNHDAGKFRARKMIKWLSKRKKPNLPNEPL